MKSLLVASLAVAALAPVRAEMMGPTSMPTKRVVANLNAHIRKFPNDPDGYYTLGRVQYALYCSDDPRAVSLYAEGVPARFPTNHAAPFDPRGRTLPSDPKTVKCVAEAIANLRKAISLDQGREPGLYHLTLACVYEASAPIAPKVSPRAGTPDTWRRLALVEYLAAFDGAQGFDLKKPTNRHGGTWEKWISVEAGEAVVRLDPRHPRADGIRRHLKAMEALPPGPITPLIFSLDAPKPLAQLLAPATTIGFDLNGTGAPQRWPWVQPDTAILVWQPDGRSPIVSGRQLFGSATWWMLFKDAYAALAVLDDDGDGWLIGGELEGLAVWRDRNQNGVSESDEVVSVKAAGIEGIATRATGRIGQSLTNPVGLRGRGGRILPTYDWVAFPRIIPPGRPFINHVFRRRPIHGLPRSSVQYLSRRP